VAADLVMSAAPPERAGSASGLNETSSEFGGALGIALLGSLLTALYRTGLDKSLPSGLSPEMTVTALRGLGPAATVAEALPDASGTALIQAARDAFTNAMQITASVSGIVVLVAAVTAVTMFRNLRPTEAPA
jgi:DHA2 family multidrug resistance protein-like MFS transporter